MPRAGLNLDSVVNAAIVISDTEGLDSLTVAKLATSLGVKAPSLYNHIACLQTLKMHLTARAFSLLLDQTRDAMAGIAGEQALVAFGQTQRRFAKVHPGLWSAVKLPRSGWNEAAQHAANAYLALALAIMRGYGLSGDNAIHASRVIRASLQGFIDLELGANFGLKQKVNLSFDFLLGMLHFALRRPSESADLKSLRFPK